MLVNGYFRVGRLAGVDLGVHWSVPVGALVFGSLRFEPVLWLGFMAVIIVHELGHAALVKSLGFRVVSIDMAGFGGQCRWQGGAAPLEHAWIAWGGVLAQGVLLLGTLAVTASVGPPASHWGTRLRYAFVEINLWIMVINMLPFAPLDGARAWGLFGELRVAGWTPGQAILYPVWRWAKRRRRGRERPQEVVMSGAPEVEQSVQHPPPSPRVRAPAAVDAASRAEADDPAVQPSAQAQRELAALLERIGEEAGKGKRRRDE